MKKSLILMMMCLAIFVAGCTSKEKEEKPSEIANLVASETTLPKEFESIARVQDPKDHVAVRVTNQEDYESMWQNFNLEGEIPEVDFKGHDLVFIGMFESSSCPFEIQSMKTDQEAKELSINFTPLDEVCTADLSPRNFVITIPKKVSSEMDSVILNIQDDQTLVPIQTDLSSD